MNSSCRVHTFPTVYFSALTPKSTHETLTYLQLRRRFPLISVNPRTQVSWKKAIEPVKMRRNLQIRNSVSDNAETQKWMKWVPKGVIAEKILRLIAGATSSPISQFVSSPTTFLHSVDPRIKLVWLLALVVLPARSHIFMRFGLVIYLALLSIWILPTQAWKDQLARVGLLSGILFIMLGLGSDGVPPLVQLRTPPPTMTGLPNLPSALGGYSYLVMKLGPLQLTRKGLSVASTSACLTFTVFQSASLCLTTTTPEQLASALRWFMLPLTHIGVPVSEVILTLLLSLRFITLVFDEVRNAALGIVARRINWQQLTVMETVDIFFMYVRRIFKNIFNHAEQISQAMIARGFRGDGNTHKIYFLSKTSFGIADFVSLLFLAGVIGAAVLSEPFLASPDLRFIPNIIHLMEEIIYSNGVAKEEEPDSLLLQRRIIYLYHELVSGKLLRPILMDEDIKYFAPAYRNCRRIVDSNPITNSMAWNGPSIFDGN